MTRRSLALLLGVLVLAPLPASAVANACQVIHDRLGDATATLDPAAAVLAEPGAGGAVDLRGLAIHPHGWGDLVIDIAVADLDAPRAPAADAAQYTVHWRSGGYEFWAQAVHIEAGWSYQVLRQPEAADGALDAIVFPVAGVADAGADEIRITTHELVLGDEEPGARILTDVWARAEEGIWTGTSTGAGPGMPPALLDQAPDTAARSVAIPLDAPCPAPQTVPVGATKMCRLLADPRGDHAATTPLIEPAPQTDLTGFFIGSTSDAVVFEIGVAGLDDYEPGVGDGLVFGASADLAGTATVSLEAALTEEGWRYDASRYERPTSSPLEVQGSTHGDRIRFEVAFSDVPEVVAGLPLSGFRAESVDQIAGVARGGDSLGAAPGTLYHTLGTPCPTA